MQKNKLSEDNIHFVNNITQSTKTIGHNKYQSEIISLNDNIEKLNKIIYKKDDELIVLKDDLKNLQLKYQEQYIEIQNIKQELEKVTTAFQVSTHDLTLLQLEYSQNIAKHYSDNESILSEKKHMYDTAMSIQSTMDETSAKYNELKSKYQKILKTLEQRTSDNTKLEALQIKTLEKLNLEKDINLKFKNKLNTLNLELHNSNNDFSILRTMLNEKDAYLKELNIKYACEKPIIIPKIQEDNIIIAEEINQVVPEPIRPLKTSFQRGLKNTKKK